MCGGSKVPPNTPTRRTFMGVWLRSATLALLELRAVLGRVLRDRLTGIARLDRLVAFDRLGLAAAPGIELCESQLRLGSGGRVAVLLDHAQVVHLCGLVLPELDVELRGIVELAPQAGARHQQRPLRLGV